VTDEGRAVMRTIVPRIRRLLEQLRAQVDIDEIEAALVRLEQAARAVALDSTTVRK
jgi:hypothetical protein